MVTIFFIALFLWFTELFNELDNFKQLHQDLSDWTEYELISAAFLRVSNFYPILTLHFINFLLTVNLNAATKVNLKKNSIFNIHSGIF